MTTNRDDLIEYFSNGKLPSGENFAELIKSLVHKDEFASHEAEFTAWTTQGEVSLGREDGRWKLFVDDEGHVHLEPEAETDDPPGAADVQLSGWVSMAGRLGDTADAAAFAKTETELDVSSIAHVPSDGGWHGIVDMPGHATAFEIVASTARPVFHKKPGIKEFLMWLVGIQKPRNALIRATVLATGAHEKPAMTTQSHPNPSDRSGFLRGYLMALFVVIVSAILLLNSPWKDALTSDVQMVDDTINSFAAQVMEMLGLKGSAEGEEAYYYTWMVILWINILYLLRLIIQLGSERRNSVRLKWVRSGGSLMEGDRAWALNICGPTYEKGSGDANLYYHITKLWA